MATETVEAEATEEGGLRSQMWKHEAMVEWLNEQNEIDLNEMSAAEIIAYAFAQRVAWRKSDVYRNLVAGRAEAVEAERAEAAKAREEAKAAKAAEKAAAKAEKEAKAAEAAKGTETAKATKATKGTAKAAPAKATRGSKKAAASSGENPFG